jgi:hypothetical protein
VFGDVDPTTLQDFMKAHLDPWELPQRTSIENEAFPETVSYRKLRPLPQVGSREVDRVSRALFS